MRLFLCEKPSQGRDIAKVLGATRRGDGCLIGIDSTVTWCIGHLLETAPPEAYGIQYKNWSLDHLPIIPEQWQVEVKPKTAAQFNVIKRLLNEATTVVIATDADREGEMIARELLDLCKYRGPVQRLWLSALNEASIRRALSSLKSGQETFPLYHSALARSRADWLIGMNLSRLFTLLGRRAGYDGVLSVGRVQTPTLRLVVDRDRAIASFVSVPYWDVEVHLSSMGQPFIASWQPSCSGQDEAGRCLQQALARHAVQTIADSKTATVLSLQTEHFREAPPLPFDLSTLQEVCSRKLGLGVQEVLNIAQALYETYKATTYPRSDCRYLPASMFDEVPAVLDALLKTDPALRPALGSLDRSLRSRAWNDAKVTAHHGIIPTTEPANLVRMSEQERNVYELIRSHYLAQFLPHHEFDRTQVELECSGERLTAVGKQILVQGWKGLLYENTEDDEPSQKSQVLPVLQQSTRCAVDDVELKAMRTAAPKPLTEGDLIKAMKNVAKLVNDPRLKQKLRDTTGIGTEATRAGIIKGLIDRGYLLKKKRALMASAAAHTLIEAVPAAIADPGMTAIWEQALDEIEAGRLTLDEFVAKQASWIAQLVEHCGALTFALAVETGPACPICNASMLRRKGKSGAFWSCSHYPDCKGTVPISKDVRRP
ncbi:DNA topoisomerase-3 [Pseudomonas chlororaphis]|uniref:DNA topoisomerase III n=1 Tax=Pseudomonas TaxID=286 RepID=UPI00087C01DE|nr:MULTISPECIES: DNA topoisomerase III [Pseudomonas]AZD67486.1 DNA topoisomerase III in PFGI-1-like cluster [Pseudomonas chlororaphis subsp. aurantiaca]PWY40429.1 DNA topoisomerase III [Pseudomonas sp. RW409]QIT23458.1 DNA topoisomerase III [Pseudomonas chlororaphis subsp. aurantiaca]WDH01549.1 DNA topoisomerase III [Pseudomonas chlororaphis]WDH09603.1 DNA topoisomerase III [Pseudomonas chlororaphis]